MKTYPFKHSVLVTAIGLLAAPAIAADLPTYQQPVAAAQAAPYDWTGFYAGIHAGAAFADSNTGTDLDGYNSLGEVVPLSSETDFIGGAQAGYNWQINSFVFGIEADISYLGYDASDSSAFFGGDTTYRAQTDWFATIRGRGGFAFNNVLIYATGGVAFSDLEYSVSDTVLAPPGINAISASTSEDVGWTIGGGVEYAPNQRWTLKGEYLYAEFDGGTATGVAAVGGGTFNFLFGDTQFNIVRIGANYRF